MGRKKAGVGKDEDVHDTEEVPASKPEQDVWTVTVLGMVCEKMAERVEVAREQEVDRRIREETVTVGSLHDEESTTQEDQEDDEGAADEREVWQVTDVTEEDFETTEVRRWIFMTNSWRWRGG